MKLYGVVSGTMIEVMSLKYFVCVFLVQVAALHLMSSISCAINIIVWFHEVCWPVPNSKPMSINCKPVSWRERGGLWKSECFVPWLECQCVNYYASYNTVCLSLSVCLSVSVCVAICLSDSVCLLGFWLTLLSFANFRFSEFLSFCVAML